MGASLKVDERDTRDLRVIFGHRYEMRSKDLMIEGLHSGQIIKLVSVAN